MYVVATFSRKGSMATTQPKVEIARKWYLVDADGKVLGRLATRVATILRGKHKPTFAPHPERVSEGAVRGILPRGRLGRAMAKNLKVYRGPEHPHASQKPEPLKE